MDRITKLIAVIENIIENEITGYIKINFSQGSLGRIEKFEEIDYAASFVKEREKSMKENEEGKSPEDGKNNISKINPLRATATIFLLLALSGCATPGNIKQAKPGDLATIHFQCVLPDGKLAAATEDNAVERNLARSDVYLVRTKTEPVSVVVKRTGEKIIEEKEISFEDEIAARLGGKLTGLKEGEKRRVELTAQDIAARTKGDYAVTLARVHTRPKEIKITIDEYKSRKGASPEVGNPFVYDPYFEGRVEDVNEKEVTIRFSARQGVIVKTPFGLGKIREEADSYIVDIDARKGSLVRSAHLVGRITEVDDQSMTIDYRNPFGGETLFCDVTVQSITEPESNKKEALEQ